jgi:hypothetical protein
MNVDINPQGVPLFPERGAQIIDALLAVPSINALAHGDDDQRRQATKMIVEQLKFEHGQPQGFTLKSASPTRPQGKDSIGFMVNGRLFGWDWQNGSSRNRQVSAGQPADQWFDQNPLPTEAVDHLRVGREDPQPEQPPLPGIPVPSPQVLIDGERWNTLVSLLGQVVSVLSDQSAKIDAIAEHLEMAETADAAEATLLGNIASEVHEALEIARGIHDTTTRTAGEAERTSTNVHQAAVKVGEIASDLAPLLNLLAAIRKK